jgi:hypothetical protein
MIMYDSENIIKNKYSYQQPNTDLTRCRVECIIFTYPIPLVIWFLFIWLGYLARITAEAHQYRNTTRQRQTGEGCSSHHIWFTRFTTSRHLRLHITHINN